VTETNGRDRRLGYSPEPGRCYNVDKRAEIDDPRILGQWERMIKILEFGMWQLGPMVQQDYAGGPACRLHVILCGGDF
jgi:hypothetical protein